MGLNQQLWVPQPMQAVLPAGTTPLLKRMVGIAESCLPASSALCTCSRRVVGIAGMAEPCLAAISAHCASCPSTAWHHGAMSHSTPGTPEPNHPSAQPGHGCLSSVPLGKCLVPLRRWMVPGTQDGVQEWVLGLRNQHPTTKYHDLAHRCL